MSGATSSDEGRAMLTFGALARCAVGVVFIYMGTNKALHPVDFLKLLNQYELTRAPWALDTIAAALPWFEIFCGLLMLAGVAVRGTSLVLAVMLVSFSVVVFRRALVMHAVKSIPLCAVKFDCGCGSGEEFVCRKLLYNAVLIALTCWFAAGRGRRFCARYRLL